jgi:spermidine synthase
MITVAQIASDLGEITILRSRANGSHIYVQGDGYQSQADGAGVSLSCYIHAMYGLIAQTRARDVLMIGCGGGTLGTMLANTGRNVTIVDVNSDSFALARRFFSLSPAITCHVSDGGDFLEQCHRSYDVIVVDAFAGDTIPEHLRSIEFFHIARRRLDNSGCILANVLLEHDLDPTADAIAACVAVTGLRVQVLDTQGELDRNAIVVGSASGPLKPPSVLVAPKTQQRQIAEEVGKMRFRAWRKRRRWTAR